MRLFLITLAILAPLSLHAQKADKKKGTVKLTTETVAKRQRSNSNYGTVTRMGGKLYDIQNSLNVWSSGMWVSTATGSS